MTPPFWVEYARVQRLVELGKSRDEQLDAMLRAAEKLGEAFDVRDSRRRQLNLLRNLARKDRNRAGLLARSAGSREPQAPEGPDTVAVRREVISEVRRAAGGEWSLLRDTLDGDYAGVAATRVVAVGTLKAQVSRARAKLLPTLRRLTW